ncbi:MAG: hypothetical protein WDA22_16310 [Bacteroidota bacterium]
MLKYLSFLSVLLLFISCNDDSTTQGNGNPSDYTNDYFPFSRSYVWTYSSNALSDSGKSISTFDTRIDTTSFTRGVFYALLGRLSGTTQWGWIFAMKDSGGIVYSLGDNPPETPYPLFKHQYSASEGVRDTLVVLGSKMETVRIDINTGNGTISLWLAKGIGLVKESSDKGHSIFNDNNSGKNIFIQTTLQSVTK